MDFSRSAMTLYNRWRGFQPWPGAWTMLGGKKLAVHRMLPTEVRGARPRLPGEMLVEQGTMFAACGEGSWLELVEVQPEGKRRMTAGSFCAGMRWRVGHALGETAFRVRRSAFRMSRGPCCRRPRRPG